MADLGGFVEGALAGQQYQQSQALFGLTIAGKEQALQEGALTIKEKELAIKNSQMVLDQQTAIMKAMQGISTRGAANDPTSQTLALADIGFQVGTAELQAGRFDSGMKHVSEASKMLKNNSDILTAADKRNSLMTNHALRVMASSDESEKGWNQAKQLFLVEYPEEAKNPAISKILQMDYKPGLVGQVRKGLQTAKDQASITASQARAVDSYAHAREADFMVNEVLPARIREMDALAEARRKNGADHLTPKKADVNDIVSLAKPHFTDVDYTDPTVQALLYDMSRGAAAAAKEYELVNKMPRAKAQDKAFSEAVLRGDFVGLPAKNAPKLGSVSDPLPKPVVPNDFSSWKQDKKTSWIKKNMKENKAYVTDKGVKVWDGTGWIDPEVPTSKSSKEPEEDDDEEDDE